MTIRVGAELAGSFRAGAVASRELEIVEVSGPEAASFLQGQVSADLAGAQEGAAVLSLLLEPNGSLGSLIRISMLDEARFLIVPPAGRSDEVAARLRRFKLRTRAEISLRPAVQRVSVDRAQSDAVPLPGAFEDMGIFEWLDIDATGPAPSSSVDFAVAAGMALVSAEISPDDVPAGTNPYELGTEMVAAAVSFTKGCYTGQELIARVDARGAAAPFRFVGIEAEQDLASGDEVEVDGQSVGEVCRTAFLGEGAVRGLARLARKIDLLSPRLAFVGGEAVRLFDKASKAS